jgi:methionine-rich copper-binding protein CopC
MLLASAPAFACPVLEKGDPRVGSENGGSVAQVTLSFSGRVFPSKSEVAVTDARGARVDKGRPFGGDKTVAVKLKETLPPGKYKVAWNVFCDCGTFTPGDYSFEVK